MIQVYVTSIKAGSFPLLRWRNGLQVLHWISVSGHRVLVTYRPILELAANAGGLLIKTYSFWYYLYWKKPFCIRVESPEMEW